MTTYHYSRTSKPSPLISSSYLKFLFFIFLFFLLDSYNFPQFFGGSYHLFLFEIGLFFLLFMQKFKAYFFTIFSFYNLIDLLQLNYMSSSFIAFLFSFFITKAFLLITYQEGGKALNKLTIFLGSFFYICIFVLVKFVILNSIFNFNFSSRVLLFFIKSCFYSCFLFLNVFLVFGHKKAA